ncbi:MAG: starch-binding protein, partial [Muribaculaceae bacterium]|nr:starch-binding protein [Muribaculaceae bacterium]
MKKFLLTFLACFGIISAHAWTVYFTNPDGWDQVAVWAWDSAENYTGGTWPGKLMTKNATTGLYSYTGTGTPTQIIFNNNDKGQKTNDLEFVDGATYDMNGPVNAKTNTYTMCYFKNTEGWEKVYVHTWDPSYTAGWPGTEMTKVPGSSDTYQWVLTTTSSTTPQIKNFLFAEGDKKRQTDNLSNMVIGATYLPNGEISSQDGSDQPGTDPKPEGPDYSKYYVNIIGEYDWNFPGQQPGEDNIATLTE